MKAQEKEIMKSKLWKQLLMAALVPSVALTALLFLGNGRIAKAGPRPGAPREDETIRGSWLVGTWKVKVQLYNCSTNTPVGGPFASLLTFNQGGTMTGSSVNPAFAAGQRGPDLGVWEHDGHRTYEAKSAALLSFTTPPSPPFNPGVEAGMQVLSQTIKFDANPDEFTSDATTEFFNAAGNLYRKGCASAVASRFE
jgi:hypothetical protein